MWWLISTVAVCLIVTSCFPAPLKPLRIGTNVWPGYEPLFLARELGYYGNTPIQLVEYPDFDPNRAYRNGEVEMAATPMNGLLTLAETNSDVRAWLIMDISEGADAIVAKPEVGNLQGLKGRKIGMEQSTLATFILTHGLGKVGLSLNDVTIVPIGLAEQEKAFKQGRVDAIVTFEPYRSNLLQAGGKLLFDSSQLSQGVVDVLIGSESLLTTHPTQLQVLIEGWFSALDYIEKNPQDAARRMAQRQGITPEQFLKSLKGLRFVDLEENQELLGKTNPALLNGAKLLSQFLVKNKILKPDVALNPLFDDRLVRNVKQLRENLSP